MFPFTVVPAYNLPVYASQRPLPDATQDSVRGCSLGFAAAVIADGRLQRACKAQHSQSGTCFACTPQGSVIFDPFCLKYIVSYLSGTVRYTTAFIGTPMEWSSKQCQTDQPFGSWADDLANAFVR